VMLWKLNAAFPSVVWQIYDWYLMPNAGYYFMQNAIEPVHIQLNQNDLKVLAINKSYKPVMGITSSTDVYDADSKLIFHEEKNLDLQPSSVKESTALSSVLSGTKGLSFVVLNLRSSAGKLLSHNVYWYSADRNYKALNNLEKTSFVTEVVSKSTGKTESGWTLKISNTSDKIAFFIRPQLMAGEEEVLPSFWSASYFTLAPKESMTVSVSCPLSELTGKASVRISALNVGAQTIMLK